MIGQEILNFIGRNLLDILVLFLIGYSVYVLLKGQYLKRLMQWYNSHIPKKEISEEKTELNNGGTKR